MADDTTTDTTVSSDAEPGTATDEPETFDRAYVQQLRDEAAKHRVKAKRADDLARKLFTMRVAALGKLADPTDLEFDERLLEDRDALERAVDELVAAKPHLGDRRPRGDVDQGVRTTPATVSLSGMLRARA